MSQPKTAPAKCLIECIDAGGCSFIPLAYADPADELARRVERVLALHHKQEETLRCNACYRPSPCPTVRALDGLE